MSVGGGGGIGSSTTRAAGFWGVFSARSARFFSSALRRDAPESSRGSPAAVNFRRSTTLIGRGGEFFSSTHFLLSPGLARSSHWARLPENPVISVPFAAPVTQAGEKRGLILPLQEYHPVLPSQSRTTETPARCPVQDRNAGLRFSRKADVPSLICSLAAPMPKSVASRRHASSNGRSSPWLTASIQ